MKKLTLYAACIMLTLAVILVCGYCAVAFQKTAPAFALDSGVTVVIDAGQASTSLLQRRCGVLESELNLQIALITNDLLRFAGVRTQMIRTQDISVYTEGGSIQEKKISDLKARVKMVENTPNALLLSIHQNFFPEAKYHGAQVFYARTPGSEDLAERTQGSLRTCADPANRRRCKPSENVYLMEKVSCTAILVECGFLSNEPEAEKLTQKPYQQTLSGAICGALCTYLSAEGESQ